MKRTPEQVSEIVDYANAHGVAAAKDRFNISKTVLYRYMSGRKQKRSPMNKATGFSSQFEATAQELAKELLNRAKEIATS